MNIGLFGGTFDPPHLGHLAAAEAAKQTLALDKLIVMPAGVPPHKKLPAESAFAAHRLTMCRLMWQEVWDWELDGSTRYTADTLARLRERFPDDTLWLLVGADMFLSLESWYKPEKIFETARIGAFAREAGQRDALEAHALKLACDYAAVTDLIPLHAVEISSTALRPLLRRGEGADYLTPEVWGYIHEHGLYNVGAPPLAHAGG